MGEFNLKKLFGVDAKKIGTQIVDMAESLAEKNYSAQRLVDDVFKEYKGKKPEEIFVSGLILGRYMVLNDFQVRTEEENR